jgi:hypothetical protein
MSKQAKGTGGAAVAESPRERLDPFAGAGFQSPILQLAVQVLGPLLHHDDACTAVECLCPLKDAIADLKRRETLVTRYGVVE